MSNKDNQNCRLLAEINAVGLTSEQLKDLSLSMDLPINDIQNILNQADDDFDVIKRRAHTSKEHQTNELAARNYAWQQSLEKGIKLCRQNGHAGDAATLEDIVKEFNKPST